MMGWFVGDSGFKYGHFWVSIYFWGVYTMPIRLLPKKNTNPRNNVPRIGLTRSPENKFVGVTESKIRGYING